MKYNRTSKDRLAIEMGGFFGETKTLQVLVL